MKKWIAAALLAALAGCSGSPAPQTATQETPREPVYIPYDLNVTLVEQEGDPRGVQLIMQQMYLPAYATAYFWSTWKRNGNAYASSREAEFYDFQTSRVSVADGPEGMKLSTYRIAFKAPDIADLPHREIQVTLTLEELALTDLRRTDLTTVFIPRVLRNLNLSDVRARLYKVELVEGEGLVGTVWVAD